MKRDGSNKSLWQTNKIYTPPEFMPDDIAYDVIIVGGGMTGIVTALKLQQAGKKCLLLEAQTLGFGTSGGTSAHLNTFFDSTYPEIEKDFGEAAAALIYTSSKRAIDLIKEHVQQFNIECNFAFKDGYLYATDDEQVKELDKIYEASLKAGCTVEYSNAVPMDVAYLKALVFKEQAQFDPVHYLFDMAKALQEAGGSIVENCRVINVTGSETLEVETTLGKFIGNALIYATHIPPGINLLHFRCAPYRSYVMAIELNDDNYPDGLVYDMEDPYHYYRTQEMNGKTYLIAGGEDHKTAHEENTQACFTRLEATIRNYFDVKEVAYKWSSQYYQPVDGLAYIGHLPGNPSNYYTATGYNGNGMIYSHLAAIIFTAILTGVDDPLIKLLDPNRIKPLAGMSEFIKEGADVVGSLAKKIFSKTKLESLSELAAGEAKIVQYEGDSVGIFKDENGLLHAVDSACTHIHCKVAWNNTERSWDCPCHGARFDMDGQMLTGPADKDLKGIDLTES